METHSNGRASRYMTLAALGCMLGSCTSDTPSATSSPVSAAGTPERCSACAGEGAKAFDATLHLHHVHLNSADRERSAHFYEAHLASKRMQPSGQTTALYAQPILLLIDEHPQPPAAGLPTALQHIGWGSRDPVAWYEAAHAAGVAPDTRGFTLFSTQPVPTVGAPGSGAGMFALLGAEPPPCFAVPDMFSYMYVLGPDQERIEVWSGVDLRVNHLHFTTPDLAGTMGWYARFLGVQAGGGALFSAFFLDDILFFFEAIGKPADYPPTDDHVLSHVAFAVRDLDGWMQRASAMQIEIVAGPTETHGFRSFFVRGPDGMLIELVDAEPSPALCR